VDEQRKHAYRWLLHWATLDIRRLQWVGGGWRDRLHPLRWGEPSEQVRVSGAIADWLHNLAMFSAVDFAQFDEEWFWREYQWLLDRHPKAGLEKYRAEFERCASSSGAAL